MIDAYLAIVSANGLELLTPETEHARQFLFRRCFGVRRGREACFWAYLPSGNIELIQWLIVCGQSRPALWLLNESAIDSGLVAPIDDEESLPEYHLVSQ